MRYLPLQTANKVAHVFDFSSLTQHLQTNLKKLYQAPRRGVTTRNFCLLSLV